MIALSTVYFHVTRGFKTVRVYRYNSQKIFKLRVVVHIFNIFKYFYEVYRLKLFYIITFGAQFYLNDPAVKSPALPSGF